MKKKTISSLLKWAGFSLVAGVALWASYFILKGVVMLAAAALIVSASVIFGPAILEAMVYGKWKAMAQMWRGNPVFALHCNHVDMCDELEQRRAAVKKLGSLVYANSAKIRERERTHPDDVRDMRPMLEAQARAYQSQLAVLERAEKAVSAYDEIIERASWRWEMGQSVKGVSSILTGLSGTDRVLMRQLREDVAMTQITKTAAEAMAELDGLIRGDADPVLTRATRGEMSRTSAPVPQDDVEVIEAQPKAPGLFAEFDRKEKVK